jgi:hypothetical protein
MKTFIAVIPKFALVFQLLTASTVSAQTFYITLQDDNGNTQVSVSWSSNIFNPVLPASDTDWLGIGGFFLNSMSDSGGSSNFVYGLGGFTGYVETLPGFGTLEDLTTGRSATINALVAIPNYVGVGSWINVRFDDDLGNATSDILQYIPSADSATISVPFSSFNQGTYEVWPQQPIGMVLAVEPVPEPSTVSLATVGSLVTLMGLRRRKMPNILIGCKQS